MTARELYECDPGFRGFLAKWDEDRRCPFPLEDYLQERDMHSQADCAKWAAEEEDRPVHAPIIRAGERDGWCGPYPMLNSGATEWVWTYEKPIRNASDLPPFESAGTVGKEYKTPLHAIIALMDAWVPRAESAA